MLITIGVVVQAAAIAYALFDILNKTDDGQVFTKDSDNAGIAVHAVVGEMVIPVICLLLLIVSFFAKIPGGVRMAAILFGLVALQVFLGIFSHSIPFVIVLHVLNAFAILGMSLAAARRATVVQETTQPSVAV